MTAVEWLEEFMNNGSQKSEGIISLAFAKAKEMEKQQLMNAIKFTIQDEFTKQTWKNGKCSHDTALNYYNNKFKINKNEKRNT
jgi:hypothetical protein